MRVWTLKPASPPLGAETEDLEGEARDGGLAEEECELGQNGEGSFEEPAVRAVLAPGLPMVRKESGTSSATFNSAHGARRCCHGACAMYYLFIYAHGV